MNIQNVVQMWQDANPNASAWVPKQRIDIESLGVQVKEKNVNLGRLSQLVVRDANTVDVIVTHNDGNTNIHKNVDIGSSFPDGHLDHVKWG